MGLRKISIPGFQKSMNGDKSFLNYPSTVLKMIFYNCRNEINFNNMKTNFNRSDIINIVDKDLYVFVDALQSPAKLGVLNEYNLELINNPKQLPQLNAYITPADIVDGASGNYIYNLIKNKSEDLIKNKSYVLSLKYTFGKVTTEILRIKYEYTNKNYKLIVENFFNNTSNQIDNQIGKVTTASVNIKLSPKINDIKNDYKIQAPVQASVIQKRKLTHAGTLAAAKAAANLQIKENIKKYEPFLKTYSPKKFKEIILIMSNKSILDLSKSLFTLYIVENIIPVQRNNKDFNYYIAYTDRIGGLISTAVGTSTVVASGNDISKYEYLNFLGTSIKYPVETISPEESKALDDEEEEYNKERAEYYSTYLEEERLASFGKKKMVRKDHELEYLLKVLKAIKV